MCWLSYKLVFRVGPGQLVLCDSTFICHENGCAWILINLTAAVWQNHETHSQVSILYSSIARKFCKYTILKVSERVRANLKQPEAEVQ